MIKVQDLKIHYGEFVAVNNLSFSVKQGSIFGLIGPNGAGKTTTIKAMATLLEPTYGEILIDQTSVLHEPEKARRMLGYMPDFPPVYDDLRVEEFCDLFAHAYGQSHSQRKQNVEQALVKTDLIEKRKDFCKSLSRGMKQRALLAKTLVHDPSVMLLDEPGANLDPKARIEMRNLLRELANNGKTIIVSSHVLTELQDLCDEIGMMKNGEMIVCGSIDEITQNRNSSKLIEIELLKSSVLLEKIINEWSSISEFKSLNESSTLFEISHSGDAFDLSKFLAKLVNEKIEIVSFSAKKSKVEDLFMEIDSSNQKNTQDL
ncbi:MAG: ABC transporter [Opitutae bacterium]|nr:ABC transporter [Opitutae bacterium]